MSQEQATSTPASAAAELLGRIAERERAAREGEQGGASPAPSPAPGPQVPALLKPTDTRPRIGEWPGKGYTWSQQELKWVWDPSNQLPEPGPDMKYSRDKGWHLSSADTPPPAKWTAQSPAPTHVKTWTEIDVEAEQLYKGSGGAEAWDKLTYGRKEVWRNKVRSAERPTLTPEERAMAMYVSNNGASSIPWGQLTESVKQLWRDRIVTVDKALAEANKPGKPKMTWNEREIAAEAMYVEASKSQKDAVKWSYLDWQTKSLWRDKIECELYYQSYSKSPAPAPSPAPAGSPETYEGKGAYVPEAIHDIPEKVDNLLVNILSWPRRHTSASELAFAKWLREYITGLGVRYELKAEGCIVAYVDRPLPANIEYPPDAATEQEFAAHRAKLTLSTTLFSCHIDTVEGWGARSNGKSAEDDVKTEEVNGVEKVVVPRKSLTYDSNFGQIALDKGSIGGSLGADDGAGVWLMLKMIERKVPGVYIFHRGEEVGCVGSSAMVQKHKEWLAQFKAAVAFDRHDTYEVIRVQGGQTCASMGYTEALCKRLNAHEMKYEPSSRGVLTDTKHYRGIIPECINVAVGYQGQHGTGETLDYSHLAALLEACCKIDWDSLPISRDPKEAETGGYGGGYYGGGYHGGGYGRSINDEWDDTDFTGFPTGKTKQPDMFPGGRKVVPLSKRAQKKLRKQQEAKAKAKAKAKWSMSELLEGVTIETLEDWTTEEPRKAAQAMAMLLVEIKQLQASADTLMRLMGWEEDEAK